MTAITMPSSQIVELGLDEIDLVNGAINWGYAAGAVATGVGLAFAIATAPATGGTSLLLLGAASGGFAMGIQVGLAVSD